MDSVDIAQYIKIGDISCFLAGDDMSERLFFNGGSPIKQLPQSIYAANLSLKSAFIRNDGTADTNSMANYLYSLCGKYIGQAKTILGITQGVVVSGTTTNNTGALQIPKTFPQFVVGSANSLMNTDGITFSIADPNASPAGIIKPEIFTDGGQEGVGLSDRLSYSYQWTPSGYTFTFNQKPRNNTLVRGYYPINVNLTTSQTAGVAPIQNLNYYATIISGSTAQSATLVNTSGQIFLVSTNSVHNISFTLFCTDTATKLSYVREVRLGIQNIANVLSILQNEIYDVVINDPFNGALGVTYNIDNLFKGFKITVTGIVGKTINCVAKFIDNTIDV